MERRWHDLRSSIGDIHQTNMLLGNEMHDRRNMPLTSHDMPDQPWQQSIRNQNFNDFLYPCYNLSPHMTRHSSDHLQHPQYIYISDVVTRSDGPQYHWWPISDARIYSSGVQYLLLPISEVGTHSIGLNHEYGQPISGVGLGSGGAPSFEFYNHHGISPSTAVRFEITTESYLQENRGSGCVVENRYYTASTSRLHQYSSPPPPPPLPENVDILFYLYQPPQPLIFSYGPGHLAPLATANSDSFPDAMSYDREEMSYEEFLELEEILEEIRIENQLSEETTSNHLSEETIAKHLNTRTHVSSANQDEEPEMCVVCQADYEKNETIARLGCGHEYHADCIKKWLIRRNVCAICKSAKLQL